MPRTTSRSAFAHPFLLSCYFLSACAQPNKYEERLDAAEPDGVGDRPSSPQPDGGLDLATSAGEAGGLDLNSVPVCGNGLIESGEECDPREKCPTACPNQGCARFMLVGSAAMCTARCMEIAPQSACMNADGCCPAGCNITTDSDCGIRCDNGVREGPETCDPLSSCPTSCPAQGCQLRRLVNPGSCTAVCVDDRQQTACIDGDSCCPSTCTNNNDRDCQPRCGNGAIEPGETCERGETRPGICGNCNRGTKTDTCSGSCSWTAGACTDPDANVGTVKMAYERTIERIEATFYEDFINVGGPCSPGHRRESYTIEAIERPGDVGTCEDAFKAYLDGPAWGRADDSPGVNHQRLHVVDDPTFCGVVLWMVANPRKTCRVTIRERRVCP